MKEDLTVEIPRRFKKDLEARFNYENAEECGKEKKINVKCPLCIEYWSKENECQECPFYKFEKK